MSSSPALISRVPRVVVRLLSLSLPVLRSQPVRRRVQGWGHSASHANPAKTTMAFAHDVVCLSDLEEHARKHLPNFAFDYYSMGALEQHTVRENTNAFRRLRIHPRVLRGISQVDMSTTVLGRTISMPICIAPSAAHNLAHPQGECATAKAAQAAGTLMAVSCFASRKLEDVASAANDCLLWFQMLMFYDREINIRLLRRAEKSGYQAVVLTVDAHLVGRRMSYLRNEGALSRHCKFPNLDFDKEEKSAEPGSHGFVAVTKRLRETTTDWSIVDWLKSVTQLPIVIKGILTAEDARKAVEHGVAGIVVSNHGGRQLDTVPATIEVLPEIVQAVQGRAEVYLDSGVRLGTDVFKALALGARAVFVGRPAVWGLAYQGEQGVIKMLELLREEFKVAMTLAGCESLAYIKSTMVSKSPYYSHL